MSARAWLLMFWMLALTALGFWIFAGVRSTDADKILVMLCLIGHELALLREGKR